jgi:predicted kinase
MMPVAVIVDCPLGECLARNAARDRNVPDRVIRRMYQELIEEIPVGQPVDQFDVTIVASYGSWVYLGPPRAGWRPAWLY